MQEMISKIVEMDRQARKMTENAKAMRNDSKGKIEQSRKMLEKKHMDEAKEKLDAMRAQEENRSAAQWREFSEKSNIIVKNLERSYNENGDKWVDEIVRRVTGG